MIPISALKSITQIVTHAACADGSAAAKIARAALPGMLPVRAFAYDDDEYINMAAVPGILCVDITPPAARAQEFVDVGAIVLDHHARANVLPYCDLGIWGDSALAQSGAWLAYHYVFRPIRGEHYDYHYLAHLSAVYDTWQTDVPDWTHACHLAALLQTVPIEYALDAPVDIILRQAGDLGKYLHAAKQAEADALAKGAYRTMAAGAKVAVLPTTQVNLINVADADIIAGFRYLPSKVGPMFPPRIKWSLRSKSGFDVSAIARRYGGGGHAAAAGFVVTDSDQSPFHRIVHLLEPS